MRMKMGKVRTLLLAGAMILSVIGLTGCFKSSTKVDDQTIRIMLMGNKPTGFEEVLAEANRRSEEEIGIKANIEWVPQGDYKQKLNLKMIAGEKYDLVFDAPWCRLKDLAAEGFYEDLARYFNNPEYPGLQAAFSEKVIESNKYYGVNACIPIMRAYGNGIPTIHYRKDLARKYGVGEDGQIDNYDQFEEYLVALQENEPQMTPLLVSNTRGFYEMFRVSSGDLAKHNIASITVGGVMFYMYIEDNEVKAIAAEGDGDEAFKDFPEPYNCDFYVKRYKTYREWNKYLDPDSLNETDQTNKFQSGMGGAMIGTADDAESMITNLADGIPEAEYGMFVYYPDIHDMKEGAIATTYVGNNCLCVPKGAKKKDMAMKYMDWIFSSQENHDLFELGIKGKHWLDSETGDLNRYAYKEGNEYIFPGYTMTLNANFVRLNDILPKNVVDYRIYETLESSFVPSPLAGFNFDTAPVITEIAKTNAVASKVTIPLAHGVLDDPIKKKEANTKEARQKGLDEIEAEVVRQVNEFLANK